MRLVISSGRARLVADERGVGAPLVLLHAGVADRRGWAGLAGVLSADYRTIAYDRRGFGETEYSAEPYNHVDDLIAVLDHCEIESAILVGNSQGGRISIDAALAHPERVRALILIGSALSGAARPESYGPEVDAIGQAIESAEGAGDLARVNELEAELWLDGPGQPAGRVAGAARELFLDMNGRALAAQPTGDEREPPSAVERLGEIAAPILVICGDLDIVLLLELSKLIADSVARGTLEIISGVAHLPQLEKLDEVVARIRDFLDREEL